jgi:hypothetical protein
MGSNVNLTAVLGSESDAYHTLQVITDKGDEGCDVTAGQCIDKINHE